MENEEEIIDRVIEASLYVPLSHLSISTRGEFDTSSLTLSEFQQWEKIQKLKDISEKIWHT
jgi:5-methyltetrahydropteroyltriglutamate--homocysteine methyltransferase